jgi:hypothetical protein
MGHAQLGHLPARQLVTPLPQRLFALKMDENKDRSSEKYSSQFDDLLSRNQTISKEEREFIDR